MSVEIPLTKGKVAIVDDCDAHLKGWRWLARYSPIDKQWYAGRRQWAPELYKNLHVVLPTAILGHPLDRTLQICHVNGDGLDCRRENLQVVTPRKKLWNTRPRREGRTSSKFVGVYWHKPKRRWRAIIRIGGVRKNLGSFAEEADAGAAYQAAVAALQKK